MPQLFAEVFHFLQPPQTRYISAQAPPFSGTLFFWAWLEMISLKKLGKQFIAQEHVILPQHFIRAAKWAKLPNSSNSRSVGRSLLHKHVRSCISMSWSSSKRHFGVKDSKHQHLSSSNGNMLLGLPEMWEAKALPTSWRLPKCKALGSAWLVLCNFNIIFPHPDMELCYPTNWGQVLFVSVRRSNISVGWSRSIFGCALVRNCGEDEESQWSG